MPPAARSGSNGEWERIGKPHGDIACFSFHPRKVITTGEGGMLTTADAELDRKFRLLRQHGMSVPDTVRHGSPQVIFEDYLIVGFNYRMTDIQAAVGRKQLERLPELVARRRALAARYAELLGNIEGLRLPFEPELGALQLAELLRAPARSGRSADGDAERCSTRASRPAAASCARTGKRPMPATSERHDLRQSGARAGSFDPASALCADERGRSGTCCGHVEDRTSGITKLV